MSKVKPIKNYQSIPINQFSSILKNISYKSELKALVQNFGPDLFYFHWRGAVEFEAKVKLNIPQYYRKFFWYKAVENLTKIGLMTMPRKDSAKHTHNDMYKYKLSKIGKKIHKTWNEEGLWGLLGEIPKDFFLDLEKLMDFINKMFMI